MGDSGIQHYILKTATTSGYSVQDEGEAGPKGSCHVTIFRTTVFFALHCEKQKKTARSILHDLCFSGLSVMTSFYLFF